MSNKKILTQAGLLEAKDAYTSEYESRKSEFSSHEIDSEIDEADSENEGIFRKITEK